MALEKHKALTDVRVEACKRLFGCTLLTIFPPHSLFKEPDERFLIDIFVYTLKNHLGDIEMAVTNGMSDQRMAVPDYPLDWFRRELIQCLLRCTERHARRLHDMA